MEEDERYLVGGGGNSTAASASGASNAGDSSDGGRDYGDFSPDAAGFHGGFSSGGGGKYAHINGHSAGGRLAAGNVDVEAGGATGENSSRAGSPTAGGGGGQQDSATNGLSSQASVAGRKQKAKGRRTR